MKNIWNSFSKPIMCLAPMEGVTDTVFRQMVVKCGRPDLMFTEFTSVDGLYSRGEEFVRERLEYVEKEKPLIAQIWGLIPENFEKAGSRLVELGFDGVDINMGCPVKVVIKKGAGGALVENRSLVKEMIFATKRGVDGRIPVSVKIRIGFREVVTEDWVSFLLEQGIEALTIHGRTVKQMSKVPADWEEIGKAVKIRDELGVDTKIIGNGDVTSLEQALELTERFGVDGVMVGRGIFQDPFLFNPNSTIDSVSKQDKLDLYLEHVKLFLKYKNERAFHSLKKFAKVYVQEFEGAKELRMEIMKTENTNQLVELLQKSRQDFLVMRHS
jgi:nifR3 family TIM-barrel protein